MSELNLKLFQLASDEYKSAFEQGYQLGLRAANRLLERNARVASKSGDVRAMKDYTHLRTLCLGLTMLDELEAE